MYTSSYEERRSSQVHSHCKSTDVVKNRLHSCNRPPEDVAVGAAQLTRAVLRGVGAWISTSQQPPPRKPCRQYQHCLWRSQPHLARSASNLRNETVRVPEFRKRSARAQLCDDQTGGRCPERCPRRSLHYHFLKTS